MKTTMIGLNIEHTEKLSLKLNELVANFQVYYQILRNLHQNIEGKSLFELHVKFEEFYTESQENIDLVAERILTLGGTPLHTFSEYFKLAKVPVGENLSQDVDSLKLIVQSLSKLLKIERSILKYTNEVGDEGTNSMMSDFITEQEKTIWMLNARQN